MIFETIVTTVNEDGSPHIAPMGIRWVDGNVLLAPFRPSTTLDNLRRSDFAVINHTDDVRIFAGCLTGRYQWPVRAADNIQGYVLAQALAHREVQVERVEEDELRPRFYCCEISHASHAPFAGFNRAQAAVIEAAILVSRLHMLAPDKIEREMEYLAIAVEKTAGPREQEAWGWLVRAIHDFQAGAKPGAG